MVTIAIFILFLPLLSFVLQIFFRKWLEPRGGDKISIGLIGITLALSLGMFIKILVQHQPDFHLESSVNWIEIGDFKLQLGFLLDNVSLIMLTVVGLVSFLVHVYSLGYMHGDIRYSRYYGYLGLFTFSMYGIVLADNLFMIYIFWELVGLSSYLLIGHWWEKDSAANAGKKAFLTTRIGDIGMFMGLMLLVALMGTLNYTELFERIHSGEWMERAAELFPNMEPATLLTWAGVLIFMGAIGKSAQFPLHVWLPDAMEGPTPVSALIHAATMVAAGVYLMARVFPILTPDAMAFVALIGGFTALYAATIAITQFDIKRVLAYSTVSQLGYMVMAIGTGAYVAGFFHLITHAMFKAVLFLGSGSVIHAMHHALHKLGDHETDPQDMRNMGGLKDKMPITYWVFVIASLSISGIPFFSGFLSKDAILAGSLAYARDVQVGFLAQAHLSWLLPFFGFTAAAITAFYMFRLIFMTFHGEPKRREVFDKIAESPRVMTIPLIILGTLSTWIFFTLPHLNPFGSEGWLTELVHTPESAVTVGARFPQETFQEAIHHVHSATMIISLVVALGGLGLAVLIYLARRISPERLAERLGALYRGSYHKWYMDEFYLQGIIRPFLKGCDAVGRFDMAYYDHYIIDGTGRDVRRAAVGVGVTDDLFVDGAVNFTGIVFQWLGWLLKFLQTGKIQNYLLFALLGALVLFALNVF